jgi:hypothetical protein
LPRYSAERIAGATIHYSKLADGYELITQARSLVQVAVDFRTLPTVLFVLSN